MSTLLKKSLHPSKRSWFKLYPLYKYNDKNIKQLQNQSSSTKCSALKLWIACKLLWLHAYTCGNACVKLHVVDFCYSCICTWGCQRKGKMLGFWSFHCAHGMSVKALLAGWTAGCQIWSAGSQGTSPNTANGRGKKERDCFTNMKKWEITQSPLN